MYFSYLDVIVTILLSCIIPCTLVLAKSLAADPLHKHQWRNAGFFISSNLGTYNGGQPSFIRIEKSFRNQIKSNWNEIVFTMHRLIWNQTDVCLVPNQLENGQYNLISVWFDIIMKRFLCVYQLLEIESTLLGSFDINKRDGHKQVFFSIHDLNTFKAILNGEMNF